MEIQKEAENPIDPFKKAMNENPLSWTQYLAIPIPHPLDLKHEELVADMRDIYEFFRERNVASPFEAFMQHISVIPYSGYSNKLEQLKHSIRLIRLADKTKRELELLGH